MSQDEPTPEDRRQMALARLEILDAFAEAVEHRARVVQVIGDAGTSDAARAQLSATFGWNEVQSTAVLDLQLRRLSEDMRRRITAERAALLAQVEQVDPGER